MDTRVRRRSALAVALAALLLPIVAGAAAAAPMPKVGVCHRDMVISVSGDAVAGHLGHGDHVADTALKGRTIYALAYTNVNGVAGYQPEGCDVFISALVEASGNNVPGSGDEVLFGNFPTAFSAPYGFAAIPETSRVALEATCDRATFNTADDLFASWRSSSEDEVQAVWIDGFAELIRDDTRGNLEDSIFASHPSVFEGRPGPTDDAFLELDIPCAV